jgi:hypothetical protein
MNEDTRSMLKIAAITANLAALSELLAAAAERSAEAHGHSVRGDRYGAIGAVLNLDKILDDAKALHGAALALHRTAGF